MKVRVICIHLLLCTFLIFGCGQNEEARNGTPSENVDSIKPLLLGLDEVPEAEEKFVVLFLGYGYNEGEKKDTLLSQLDEVYGLAENGGIIIPFVFPDDFISFGYERITLLLDNITGALAEINEEEDLTSVAALITLGAPEGTHVALANLQDTGNDIPVFSVFPQDNILGTEAGSTLVIDYSISEEAQQEGYESLGEIDLSYPDNIFNVLFPLINSGLHWEDIHASGLFVPALRSEYNKRTNCDFFVYVDPQTGLRAENHYVLTQKN